MGSLLRTLLECQETGGKQDIRESGWRTKWARYLGHFQSVKKRGESRTLESLAGGQSGLAIEDTFRVSRNGGKAGH